MNVRITQVTDYSLMSKACSFTAGYEVNVKSRKKMFQAEHSPMRTQLYWVEMYDIPTFVSTHLVRHKIGVEHFVKSNRHDRGGDDEANRYTPVHHAMLINAQSLINIARKRLCFQASDETRELMEAIKKELIGVDEDLGVLLVPECVYRGNLCYEFKCCGFSPKGN